MTLIADAKERKEALNPSRSFLVQAPAGSGKTELLIQRFLKLLGGVEYPEQILAMTFTRKAAGEMKNRIYEALNQAGADAPVKEPHQQETRTLAKLALKQDQQQGWRLLDNPNRLKVQTIDSFCAGLIKQMPILSWMGGSPDIQDNPRELYRETAERLLSQVESENEVGGRVRNVLNHLDNSKEAFLARVTQLLEKRDQWMIPFFDAFTLGEKSRASHEETFTNLIESVLNEISRLCPAELIAHFPGLAEYAGKNIAEENPNHPLACLTGLSGFPDPSIESLPIWKGLAELLLTTEGDFRKAVNKKIGFPSDKSKTARKMKKEFVELLESLSAESRFREKLHEIRSLPHPRLSEDEWNILQEMLLLLPELSDILRKIFAERGLTDFTEISLAAGTALESDPNPTELLQKYDHKILHILVDEYQDTSYKQYDLLKRLTAGWFPDEGRTLFIVGDPMQSIYRFRDAEVGLFLRTRNEGIGNIQLYFLTLKTNFRSTKRVVDWVNECFSRVFPGVEDQDLGAIPYTACTTPPNPDPPETDSGVFLHPMVNSSEEEEARQIVFLIQKLQGKHMDGENKKSIAVLVRARNHLRGIVREFHKQGIRFQAKEIDPLVTRPVIQDLLALMRALLSSADRVAWLSILRAPWCGLTLEDLHKLCAANGKWIIREVLNAPQHIATLSADAQSRLERFVPALENALKALPSANFRNVLEGCWIHLGGPACADAQTLQDVEVFFDEIDSVLDLEDITKLRSFHRFLDNLYANPTVEGNNPIQVMTMHKAKGLEFDFVILPGLGKISKAEEKRLVYWMPHGENLLIAPIEEKGGSGSEVYNFLSRMDRKKEEYETRRLLYVATTRAKSQLHLFGYPAGSGKDLTPPKRSLLHKLWPAVNTEWKKRVQEQIKTITPTGGWSGELSPPPFIRRLPETFTVPEPPAAINTGTEPELEEEPEQIDYVWAGWGVRVLGTVLHQCFQYMAENGVHNWDEKRLEGFEKNLNTALLAKGLPQEIARKETKNGLTALRNILEDEKGRWILQNHEEARSEYPLTFVRNDVYVSRIIDRTFVEDGVRWIIDYKTGKHEGGNPEYFFEEEKKRYSSQLNEYEKILREKDKAEKKERPIKKALYYPMHKRLVEL